MYRAGIDLGGTNIKAAILDEQNQILAEDQLTGVGIGCPGTIDAELEHDASAEKVVSN